MQESKSHKRATRRKRSRSKRLANQTQELSNELSLQNLKNSEFNLRNEEFPDLGNSTNLNDIGIKNSKVNTENNSSIEDNDLKSNFQSDAYSSGNFLFIITIIIIKFKKKKIFIYNKFIKL